MPNCKESGPLSATPQSRTSPSESPESRPWHALSGEEAVAAQGVDRDGLDPSGAAERLATHGPNTLPEAPRRGPLARFLSQFNNVLIYVLLAAGVGTLALRHWADAAVIFGVVIINAIVGFVQEGKAEHALDAIRGMLSHQATVIRGGQRRQVPAEELVPGDIVLLESGDRVPADMRLLETRSLRVQEAALTGESLPVDKSLEPVAEKADLGDRTSMAYSGTLVAAGRGTGVVVATGAETEIGRISTMLSEVRTLQTPLLAQMAQFSRWLTGAIVVLALLVFGFGVLVRDYTATEMFLAAVSLAVAAIPEGLPAIMTITLAIGVQRMARRNAIIRRLPAVETLGSVSVICTDKTGTLTRNEMTVQSIATAGRLFDVSGIGYAPEGEIRLRDEPVGTHDYPLLEQMVRGALLCSDAVLREVDGDWTVEGDPTEGAIIALAGKAGLDGEAEAAVWPRIDVIPFESEHRFMATLHHHSKSDSGTIYVKGAPEKLLSMCSLQAGESGDEPLDADYWHERVDEIAGRGQRVLALAARHTHNGHRNLDFEDVSDGMVLLGLFGLADPPREEAIRAIERCRSAGIRVKMITGDHVNTARAIGESVGLESTRALSGHELDEIDDEVLPREAAKTDVFARASPEHKLRLVKALQTGGQVVSMTGDGVNDAPALKRADVGVAMGRKGTEAAREAAEMVLADDNFASIAHAVEEGRTVYDNLKKSIAFILPTNGGEALMIIAAIAMGRLLPITPVQILWINMITAVTLALALAFEPTERGVMKRPPRASHEPLLSGFLIWRIVFVSVILLTGTTGLFLWERGVGTDLETARTVALNTLVLFEAFYLISCRQLHEPAFGPQLLRGAMPSAIAIVTVLLMQLLMTYTTPFQALFDTRALDGAQWLRIVAVAASVLVLVELEKWVMGRHRHGPADASAHAAQS
ncbi:cation-transporting P-type ATPase [Ectothiorhodospiraceae bacterium WFHF3C12]|nr:cation-transporting P-type ATPase [Ectothiorhodospiraceae bacterium WFHF3C12]